MTEPVPAQHQPVAYRFAWTPALYAEIVGRRAPTALGVTGSRRAMAGAVLAALALIAGLAVVPVPLGLYGSPGVVAALWGATAALLTVLLVVIPHIRRSRVAADLATRMRQGEVHVRLSSEGVETETMLSRAMTRWPGVALVSETPRTTLLWLGALMALPVPDAALPAGVVRRDLLDRIAAWRAGAEAGDAA